MAKRSRTKKKNISRKNFISGMSDIYCVGHDKIGFKRKKDAKLGLKRAQSDDSNDIKRFYFADRCNLYHLTSKDLITDESADETQDL